MAADHDPRRTTPGTVFTTTDAEGREVRLKADDDGVARPTTDAQKALADHFDLPVARAAKAEAKAEAADKAADTTDADAATTKETT